MNSTNSSAEAGQPKHNKHRPNADDPTLEPRRDCELLMLLGKTLPNPKIETDPTTPHRLLHLGLWKPTIYRCHQQRRPAMASRAVRFAVIRMWLSEIAEISVRYAYVIDEHGLG
jgi:hypothetical protein